MSDCKHRKKIQRTGNYSFQNNTTNDIEIEERPNKFQCTDSTEPNFKIYHHNTYRKPIMGRDGIVVYVPKNCEFNLYPD